MRHTKVGDIWLPELPPGTPVAFDTEASGLHPDGDPGGDTGDPGSPPARISAASIAYRDRDSGELVKHAWGFDQGPHPDKPGRIRRPREGGGVEPLDVDRMLAALAKAGFGSGEAPVFDRKGNLTDKTVTVPYTQQQAYRAEGVASLVRLLRWLSRRDRLVMHHTKYDQNIAKDGPRDELALAAWDGEPDLRQEFGPDLRDTVQWRRTSGVPHIRDGFGRVFGLDLDLQSPHTGDDTLRPVRGIWDTMLVQAFFDPRESVALKKTAKRRRLTSTAGDTQQALLDAMRKQGVGLIKRYDLTPWPIMEPYAADDAELTLLLFEDQLERIEQGDHPPQLWEQIDKEFELSRVLWRMERRGMQYDVEASREGARRLQQRMGVVAQKLPYDPSKLAEIKKFYFGHEADGGLGVIPLKVTEARGEPCLDEAQVRLLVQSNKPWAAEYDEWSHCRSALSKWYRGWADKAGADGRLRTVFKQCVVAEERAGAKGGGTISGRLAVGRVQLQAIPHNSQLPQVVRNLPVRSLIGARPGYTLYEMDLPQGEVRIATVIVGCNEMWDVIDTGADLHGENAKRIFGIGEDHPDYDDLRGVAKRIVFGTLYGAGVRTLRQQIVDFTGLDYSEDETKAAKDAFDARFPEFSRVARTIQHKADRLLGGPGYVSLIDGRRRWFGPEERSHKAFNAVIQGDLAQTGKDWMIATEREVPGVQVLAIHDSIVVEVPDDEFGYRQAQQVAAIGKRVYERDYTRPERGNRPMYFNIVPEPWSKKALVGVDQDQLLVDSVRTALSETAAADYGRELAS